MKNFYLIALFALVCNFASAQIESVSYRGAFAPAPTAMWTDSWTSFDPKNEAYTDAVTVVNVTTDITVNTTWTAGNTYYITGLIYVRNNATLTIQPGVVVKGNYTSSGTALVVTKGAKLNAVGTAAAPIVFTSAKTVAEGRQAGDWGGIILLGKAGFNLNNGVNNIEGITASVNTQYGGGTTPLDTDSSGSLKYVRIEFGGFVFSPNNEINGLTFGSVGSGTTIDYVQVSYSGDDSFEWFGGSVNCKHLVAYRGLDDDFDTDNGYKGFVQFALGIRDPSIADNPVISTSEGFESDNNASTTEAGVGYDNTTAIFTNCTLLGPSKRATTVASGYARALRLRRSTELKIYNSIFLDFKNNFAGLTDDQTIAKYYSDKLKLKNNTFGGFYGTDFTNFPEGINPRTKTGNATTNTIGGLTVGTVFNLGTKMIADGNTTIASSDNILTLPYNTSDYTQYTGLDYRPLSGTGADFTDSSLAAKLAVVGSGNQPTTTALSYCKGTIGVPALTAVLSATGVSLKWYTVPTGGVALASAPVPSTSVTKTYYVSELNASNVESARTSLVVTILATPTIGLGTIAGTIIDTVSGLPVAATTTVGLYLGTSTVFTYSVATSTDPTVTSYLWTVPSGVNILSGQGTNTITVNYLNVPQGAGTVGTISAQGVNALGCTGVASILVVKKALAKAPSLKMYDKNSAKPTSPLSSFGQFAGTTTPVTLVSSTVSSATGYQWELPTGVSVVTGSTTPVTTTVTYTAEPFLSPNSAPSTVGTKYWVVTYNTYTGVDVNGVPTKIVISTADQKIFGNTAFGGIKTAPYAKYGTVIVSDLPSIVVSFSGVGTASKLYLGVKSVNGVGASIKDNNTAANAADIAANVPGINYNVYTETYTAPVAPSTNATSSYSLSGHTPSTATLLKLVSLTPLAPSAIKSLNGVVSVTDISTYVGTTNVLTLTCTAVANASSYTWTLPAGVTKLSGGTTNTITVNYAGVAPGTSSVAIAVHANNNVGSSADKTATLTAVAPATAAAPTGTLAICSTTASSVTYTIVALAKNATSYNITLPAGATIGGNPTATIAAVANATFTVDFASGFVSTSLVPLYITIQSQNGFGVSLVNRSIKLTNTGAVCGPRIASDLVADEFKVTAYPNPSSSEFTIDVQSSRKGASNVQVYDMVGRLIENRQTTSNQVQVGRNYQSGIYNVIVNNGSQVKTLRVIKK